MAPRQVNARIVMDINEGVVDRTIRIVAGAGLVGAAALGLLGWWAWIGVVPLVTGIVGTCPLYSMLGVRTCAPQHR